MRKFFLITCLVSVLGAADAPPAPPDGAAELETLRGIAAAGPANMADLCDLILIQRGEFAKYKDSDERCKAVSELKIYNFSKTEIPLLAPLTAGAAAKAAIRAHKLDQSVMFTITGLEWYAAINGEELGILPSKTLAAKHLTGDELLAVFEKALMRADDKAGWGKPKNPYEAFGANSYEEINKQYDEATKPEQNTKKKEK